MEENKNHQNDKMEEHKEEKQENKPQENHKDKETAKKKSDKQLLIIVVIMISVLVVIALWSYAAYKTNHFEYRGLKFDKLEVGELTFYSTKLSIGGRVGDLESEDYTMNLRTDPRQLGKMNIGGPINFKPEVVFAMNPEMDNCGKKTIAVANFGMLLDFIGISYRDVGTNDVEYANSTGIAVYTCYDTQKFSNRTVIVMQNDTRNLGGSITETLSGCYVIDVHNCEFLESLEAMMLDYVAARFVNV